MDIERDAQPQARARDPAHGREEMPYADGPVVRVVDSEIVEAEFARTNIVNSEPEKTHHAQHVAYNRALKTAQDRQLVGVRNNADGSRIVWLG